jgi:predicted DNA-binding transcriptional regulator AlpA
MQEEIYLTLKDISVWTGLKLNTLGMMIKRGVLPEGYKLGNKRYLPAWVIPQIIEQKATKRPMGHWKPIRLAPPENQDTTSSVLSWDQLLR